jgi:serine/threonine protein kinase
MYDILKGLEYMDKRNIIHRDIKLQNILISRRGAQRKYLICDFGLAVSLENLDLVKSGTPGFIAPEIFTHYSYNTKVDMFSAGVILFSLLTGYFPFSSKEKNYKEVLLRNKKAEIIFKAQS